MSQLVLIQVIGCQLLAKGIKIINYLVIKSSPNTT